jgi:hypothetical protein
MAIACHALASTPTLMSMTNNVLPENTEAWSAVNPVIGPHDNTILGRIWGG